MATTRKLIRQQVLKAVANVAEILADDVNEMLEADDAEILESWPWTRRIAWTLVNTTAPSTLTVGVTEGSSVVTGAGFTAAMVGRLIRLADTGTFYRIASVTAGVSAVIGDSDGNAILYPGSTNTALTATLFQYIYAVATNAERVIGIYHSVPLTEMDDSIFNRIDSQRIATADPPEYWSHLGRNSSGVLQVGLFPYPSAAISLRVKYLKVASMTKDTDVPMYHPAMLRHKTSESAAAFLLGKTGDAAWATLADRYNKKFDEAYQAAKEDDLQRASSPTAITPEDAGTLMSNEFALSHDVEPY